MSKCPLLDPTRAVSARAINPQPFIARACQVVSQLGAHGRAHCAGVAVNRTLES